MIPERERVRKRSLKGRDLAPDLEGEKAEDQNLEIEDQDLGEEDQGLERKDQDP